jgi:hypothetical protein
MSISSIASVAASAVLKPPEASDAKPPGVQPATEAVSSRAAPKPVLAALPPGQGTRVNQLA